MSDPFPVGNALRLLRTRQQLTQTAASRGDSAPDFRTLSHWETGRKLPSLGLLQRYLASLDYDFADFQRALDQVNGQAEAESESLRERIVRLEHRLSEIERGSRPASPEACP